MKRTVEQNRKFYRLLSLTNANKSDVVKLYTAGRTEKSSEMSEMEMEQAIETLQQLVKTMNNQRRRIFSRIRQIKLISCEDKLSEADVMRYINNIVGLKVRKVTRLNDYTKEELQIINRKLDAIKPKQIVKYRKNLKIV